MIEMASVCHNLDYKARLGSVIKKGFIEIIFKKVKIIDF